MNMANGTQQNDPKLGWKPRKTSTEIRPDAPDGEWIAQIPRNKCAVKATRNGDPRIVIPFKLLEAADDDNSTHVGAEVTMSVIVFDEDDAEKRRGGNMMKQRLRNLCASLNVDLGEVWPAQLESAEDLQPFFDAIEGKKLTIWTVNSERISPNGEKQTDTDIRFSKPGAGLEAKGLGANDEPEDVAPRGGKSKPAASIKKKR